MNKNIIEFYFKALNLKNINRAGWIEVGITNVESVMDHIGGTVILAMAINSEKNLNLDMNKVYEMIIIKELYKSISSKEESIINGEVSSNSPIELLKSLSNNSKLIDAYNEYIEGNSNEAKFSKMISKLESDFQAKKYEIDGKFTIENAKKDIENFPEEIKSNLTNISKASDGWLEYDRKYYDDMFKEISSELNEM